MAVNEGNSGRRGNSLAPPTGHLVSRVSRAPHRRQIPSLRRPGLCLLPILTEPLAAAKTCG
jgi:hypothetical protein